MVQTTDSPTPTDLDANAFYDALGSDYDRMTGFERRFAREEPFFRPLVEQHQIRSAVDAGCGTGFHAFLLARLGVDVVAVDSSETMLELLRSHQRELGLTVSVVTSLFGNLPQHIAGNADAVVCMGNALAHLLSREELHRALRAFAAVTRGGGILLAQVLNYEQILASGQRIVGVTQSGDTVFVRFYDFLDTLMRFNILRIRQSGSVWIPNLQGTLLRPLQRADLTEALAAAGYTDIRFFGSMALDPFVAQKSRDLVIQAVRER